MATPTIEFEAFSRFMESMRCKYHKKTTEISAETGISVNYLYKMLNGHKRTKIRDYVLLICISTGMDLSEINTALALNDMRPISRAKRDQIIARCIADGRNIRMINESLEEADLPTLAFSYELYRKMEDEDETD